MLVKERLERRHRLDYAARDRSGLDWPEWKRWLFLLLCITILGAVVVVAGMVVIWISLGGD
jgi:hypothetical protein